MASASGIGRSIMTLRENCFAHAIRGRRNAADANADGVFDSIENRGCGGNHRLLADSLSAKRTDRGWVLDEDRFNGRHVSRARNQVVVKVLAFSWEELFHEGHAEALSDSTLDLTFDQRGIDGAADIVRSCDLQNTNSAQISIHH